MYNHPDLYKEKVIDDINCFEGLSQPVKANPAERLLISKLPINKLHPNPQDEFCDPDIGPNYNTVNDYRSKIRRVLNNGGPLFKDPIYVEKMSTGGYMILNGHHRWLAACYEGLKALPVRIVNVTQPEDIVAALNASERDMCVAFDIDEILLTDGSRYTKEKELRHAYAKIFPQTLRKNSPQLISSLQLMGFDVWIYSGSYESEEYFEKLFSLYGVKVDGIVNGITAANGPKKSAHIKSLVNEKYKIMTTIDNEGVIMVEAATKETDIENINASEEAWASSAMRLVSDMVKKHREGLDQ